MLRRCNLREASGKFHELVRDEFHAGRRPHLHACVSPGAPVVCTMANECGRAWERTAPAGQPRGQFAALVGR